MSDYGPNHQAQKRGEMSQASRMCDCESLGAHYPSTECFRKLLVRVRELEARVNEEEANYVAMMDLRDKEIRENARLRKQVEAAREFHRAYCTFGIDMVSAIKMSEALREPDGEKTECVEHSLFTHTPDNKTACGKCHKVLE